MFYLCKNLISHEQAQFISYLVILINMLKLEILPFDRIGYNQVSKALKTGHDPGVTCKMKVGSRSSESRALEYDNDI